MHPLLTPPLLAGNCVGTLRFAHPTLAARSASAQIGRYFVEGATALRENLCLRCSPIPMRI
jgi:hypothetical protein